MASTRVERAGGLGLASAKKHPRVLILATDVFTRGGIARYTSTFASALGKLLGSENVDVLTFFDWGPENACADGFRFLGSVSTRKRADIVSQIRFLVKALRAGRKCDLVIANHVALAPVATLLRFLFRMPYWVVCHSLEVWWGTSWARRCALANAELVLPVSRYTAEMITARNHVPPSRMRVLYNAIPRCFTKIVAPAESPDSSIARLIPARDPLLLSVCALVKGNEFKGVDTVIRALPAITRQVPTARYAIVGSGEIREALEALAQEIGVSNNVFFLGEVTDTELAALYRRCHVFVLPSRGQEREGREGGEGFGRVYAEAAFAGKPVIGSISGGAAEAVIDGNTGFLVDPLSVADVAEATISLLLDPTRAARMGMEGRRWAQGMFSEDALSMSLQRLLQGTGLIKGHAASEQACFSFEGQGDRPLSTASSENA